jgi:alginate O-acetyltransferase complex protein AlgI
MSLVGVEFAFFLPLVLAVHWLLPRRAGLQNGWMLFCSALFYASVDAWLLPWILVSIVADHRIALWLGLHPARADGAARGRRLALGLSLLLNLGLLAWFKYSGSLAALIGAVGAASGSEGAAVLASYALPLGVSYWTLIKLGYVLDVYHGWRPPCASLPQFATFVLWFPHLTAGPIARSRELLPQFAEPRRPTPEMVAAGCGAVLLGYALKGLSGDLLGQTLVVPVFEQPEQYRLPVRWAALFGFAVQVFGDFAGYSLIAIGVSRLFGVELARNFDLPFLSRSLPELWRRWHITLNRWLFDHIFTPVVTARTRLRGRIDLALLMVFAASGIWHGSTGPFVLWGLLHGLGMVVQRRYDERYKRLCRADRRWVERRRSLPYQLAAWALTIGFFVATLIPFRCATLAEAGRFAGLLFSASGDRDPGLFQIRLLLGFGLVAAMHALALPPFDRLAAVAARLPAPVRGLGYGLAIVVLLIFVPVSAGTFIYGGF